MVVLLHKLDSFYFYYYISRSINKAIEETTMSVKIIVGNLTLGKDRFHTTWKDCPVLLLETEYQALKSLIANLGLIVSRDQIIDYSYPDDVHVFFRTIDTLIKRIRKKIRKVDPDFNSIKTHNGSGYSFEALGCIHLSEKTILSGPLRIRYSSRTVFWDEESIRLTKSEFEILFDLVNHKGHIKTRYQLLQLVNSSSIKEGFRLIDTLIKKIRKKIKTVDPDFNAIKTHSGEGYSYRSLPAPQSSVEGRFFVYLNI